MATATYTQAQINAALAAELAARPDTSQAALSAYAKANYGLTDAQLNAAYDTIPGFNAKGQWDANDYIENNPAGQVSPQMVVDAAREAAKNELRTLGPQQSITDPITGQVKSLTRTNPDFNPNDYYTLVALGSVIGKGDTNANAFFAENPTYVQKATDAWNTEKARLEEIDRQAGLLNTPTSQTTQTAQTQTAQTYTPAETALYNAYRSGDYAAANRAIQSGKLTSAQVQSKFGLSDADMVWMANNAGIKFYSPTTTTVTGTGTVTPTANIVNADGSVTVGNKTYTAAEEALYNAYRAGNIAEFNRLTAANKFTAGNIQSKFGLTDADMNWIINNAGGKFYSEAGTGPGKVPGGVPGVVPGGLGGLGGLGGISQNFANYQSIPIGAQYNPNVVGGTGSPYAQVMGQMQPFQNPYANMPVNTPMGGYDPGLYDRLLTNAAAKADVLARGGNVVEVGGVSGDTGVSQESINDSVAAANNAAAVTGESVSVSGETGESVSGIYNKGGIVDGLFGPNPPGPDDGAGLLDRGEYVIRKSSVNKYGRGLLDMINEGKVPAKKLKSLLG